jgi:hypothetical protein
MSNTLISPFFFFLDQSIQQGHGFIKKKDTAKKKIPENIYIISLSRDFKILDGIIRP